MLLWKDNVGKTVGMMEQETFNDVDRGIHLTSSSERGHAILVEGVNGDWTFGHHRFQQRIHVVHRESPKRKLHAAVCSETQSICKSITQVASVIVAPLLHRRKFHVVGYFECCCCENGVERIVSFLFDHMVAINVERISSDGQLGLNFRFGARIGLLTNVEGGAIVEIARKNVGAFLNQKLQNSR